MANMTLDDLVAQLRAAYGSVLRAVVLYGSAAGDKHDAKRSDYNVLVVVNDLALSAMQAAGATAQAWTQAGNPPPLTLTDAEWHSSVDVFAIEHADIRDRHRVLYVETGYELFREPIAPADIRLQLEYEAMGTLLRVRGEIMAAGDDAARRLALLSESVSRVLVLFRTTLRLLGEPAAADYEALCRTVGTRAGLDPAPFLTAVRHRRGTQTLEKGQVADTVAAYHAGLARLVAFLDALPVRE